MSRSEPADAPAPAADAPPAKPLLEGPAQLLAHDVASLNSFEKNKDPDLGTRITRHLKLLRRQASFALLRPLWARAFPGALPAELERAASLEADVQAALEQSCATASRPTRIYLKTLLLLLLLREKQLAEAAALSTGILEDIEACAVWYLDSLWAFVYSLYIRAQELAGNLAACRVRLFELYRAATVTKRESSQATLLNLLLRCFIASKDFLAASEFIRQTLFPENKMNNEFLKYLYYTGYVKAVELDYQEAFARVNQALRKSPEKSARGFKLSAQKLSIVVEMLLGEVPSRSQFAEGELAAYLFPYYQLTSALVKGDVSSFDRVVEKYRAVFLKDGLLVLINRLTLNVIRAGLKKINLSYSRISFADIALKLCLPRGSDVESLVSKAIRDGVVSGSVDVAKQELLLSENKDTYGTNVPQLNFQKRIDFCSAVIHNCSRAILYKHQEPAEPKKQPEAEADDMEKLLEAYEDDFF